MIGYEQLAQELILWVRDTITSVGSNGVVFGMSGGVDSSVVSVICKKACVNNVLGLIMPCHSDDIDKKHAELVANKFNIPVNFF